MAPTEVSDLCGQLELLGAAMVAEVKKCSAQIAATVTMGETFCAELAAADVTSAAPGENTGTITIALNMFFFFAQRGVSFS